MSITVAENKFIGMHLDTLAEVANSAASSAEKHASDAVECAIACGRSLLAAKEQVGHGGWCDWVERNLSFSPQTARKYMKVAKRNHGFVLEGVQSLRQALEMLSETDDDDEAPASADAVPIDGASVDAGICYDDISVDDDEAIELAPASSSSKPHVLNNSGENEWYTPPVYIEAARKAMGSIDLDPASSKAAQKTVRASFFYTAEEDGLEQTWGGNVWLNPPYSAALVKSFAEKVIEQVPCFDQAVVLVNNATETGWFQLLLSGASAMCLPRGRISFLDKSGEPKNTPLQGQSFLYFGPKVQDFRDCFTEFGRCFECS